VPEVPDAGYHAFLADAGVSMSITIRTLLKSKRPRAALVVRLRDRRYCLRRSQYCRAPFVAALAIHGQRQLEPVEKQLSG